MDFAPTGEQALIRDSARRFAERHGKFGARLPGSAACWRELAEAGFLALGLPEQYGGFGGAAEIALVAEEFGRALLPAPYTAALFAGQVLRLAGSEAQCTALLPALAAGERRAAVAYVDAGDDAVTAGREGDGYRLNGRKVLIHGGSGADVLIVSAVDAEGETGLFLVDPRDPGVVRAAVPVIDGSDCAEVVLQQAAVPAMGRLPGGARELDEALRHAILGVSAEMVGASAAALATTIDYLKNRSQFGAPLASFQVLRHRVADMTMDCELARSALYKLLASFDDPAGHDPAMSCALAKVTIDEIAVRVTGQAIQLHGAMGLTEECAVGHYHTRATLVRALFGSAAEHAGRYVEGLQGPSRSGAKSD